MAISDITKPMALDETLQATNGKMDSVITKLQGIIDALGLDTSVYKPKGNITCAALVPALLIDDNLGNVYNVTDNGTTTSDFVEGAGKPIHVGDNVAIVDVGTGGQSEYKFDLLAGMVDLTNYIQKSNTSGLVKNDGTIDTKDYAEKVSGATNGNLAGLNGSGNLTDSGVAASEIPALWKSQGEYGVKNLIPYPWTNGSGSLYQVTFTDNGDGSIKVNGTASQVVNWSIITPQSQKLYLKAGDYALSGCPSGSSTTYELLMVDSSGTNMNPRQYGDTVVVTVPTDGYYGIKIVVRQGATINNVIYKPMLRIAADTDDTYRPYAKTNKQLTDEVAENIEDIDTLENRADNTTTSISGNPISITGLKANQLAVNPIITFEPIQAGSGTPSPSNIRAISGYDKIEVLSCGKNLLSIDDVYMTGKTSSLWYNFLGQEASILDNATKVSLYAGTYYIKLNNASGTSRLQVIRMVGGEPDVLVDSATEGSFTLSKDDIVYLRINASASTISFKPMLELGSSASAYQPYHKTTDISESLGQTVYGGSLDLRTGKLTVDRQIVDLGSLDWVKNTNLSVNQYVTSPIISGIKPVSENTEIANIICSMFYAVSRSTMTESILEGQMAINTSGALWIALNGYADATAFKTAMSGVELVYELATPFTIQLTPHEISLLSNYAYVSTNGTNIALDYHNGELASLADVSQLGETVNELGKYSNLKDISSEFTINTTSGSGGAQLLYDSKANIVFINAYFNATTSVAYTYVIGTISEKYRPSNTVQIHGGIYINASDAIKFGNFNMYANGSLLNANSSWKSVHVYGWYTVQ